MIQMEKIFSHAWRGRHGCESKEELEQLQERQTTPEEIQGQFIDDDQVLPLSENILSVQNSCIKKIIIHKIDANILEYLLNQKSILNNFLITLLLNFLKGLQLESR